MSPLLYLRLTTRTDFINYYGLLVSIDGVYKIKSFGTVLHNNAVAL